MELKEAQAHVDRWIETYGVRYFNELTNMVLLTEEVGELARLMARNFGEQSFKATDEETSIEDELADILFVLICIANQTGTDLEAAFTRNLDKKSKRDASRHLQNKKLNP